MPEAKYRPTRSQARNELTTETGHATPDRPRRKHKSYTQSRCAGVPKGSGRHLCSDCRTNYGRTFAFVLSSSCAAVNRKKYVARRAHHSRTRKHQRNVLWLQQRTTKAIARACYAVTCGKSSLATLAADFLKRSCPTLPHTNSSNVSNNAHENPLNMYMQSQYGASQRIEGRLAAATSRHICPLVARCCRWTEPTPSFTVPLFSAPQTAPCRATALLQMQIPDAEHTRLVHTHRQQCTTRPAGDGSK